MLRIFTVLAAACLIAAAAQPGFAAQKSNAPEPTALGDQLSGDARMMLAALHKVTGGNPAMPDVPVSHRGEAIKRALLGEEIDFQPNNDIDALVHLLIQNLR